MPSLPPSSELRSIVIVATYNERENLPELVEQLQRLFPETEVLVIDDNSPDGTGDWCRARQQSDARFQCVHRAGKLGLGSATIEGFEFALKGNFDLVATMDADFSHDPKSLLPMTEILKADAEREIGVVIGSRYIDGGAIEGWPWARHFSSRMVNRFAQTFLRLPARDNSGAFRVYRRETLEQLGLQKIEATGYAYLEEILWRIHRQGIKMVEVPITFRDRTKGKSKTSLKMGVQVFWHLTKLALGVYR